MQTAPNALTGKELLDKLKELVNAPVAEKAKQTGYAIEDSGRVSYKEFYRAVAEAAAGGVLPAEGKSGRKRHALAYEATVLTTGAILVGNRYVEQLGLSPGDRVQICVEDGALKVAAKPKDP